MTPRERMLSAIDRKPVDRLPFCTYNCHPFTNSPHVSDPAYAPILDAIRETSAGCLCKTSVRRLAQSSQSVRAWTEGSSAYRETTRTTPLGTITRIDRTPEGQPSLCVKAFVETDRDVETVATLTKGQTGYICCSTCTPFQYPPSETYVSNYVTFLKTADRGWD